METEKQESSTQKMLAVGTVVEVIGGEYDGQRATVEAVESVPTNSGTRFSYRARLHGPDDTPSEHYSFDVLADGSVSLRLPDPKDEEIRRLQKMLRHQADISEQHRRETLRAERELEAFKESVVEVADRYGREHDWCSVVDSALAELGLERKPRRWTVPVTVSFQVTIDAEDEDDAREAAMYVVDGIDWSGHDDRDPEVGGIYDKGAGNAERVD